MQPVLAGPAIALAHQTRLLTAVLKKNPPFGTWCDRNGGRLSRSVRCTKLSKDEAEVLMAFAETQGKAQGVRQFVVVALAPWRPELHVLPPRITLAGIISSGAKGYARPFSHKKARPRFDSPNSDRNDIARWWGHASAADVSARTVSSPGGT